MRKLLLFLCAIAFCIMTFSLQAFNINSCNCNPCFCQNEWFLSGECLIFKACQDGMPIGYDVESFEAIDGLTPIEANGKSFHSKWDTGFRFGIGYSNPCNCWGAEIFWTQFNSSTHRHLSNQGFVPSTGSIFFFQNAWGGTFNTSINVVRETEASWKLNLNMIDFQIARWFDLTDCIKVRPIVGVRAAWVNQSLRILNVANSPTTGQAFDIQNLHIRSNYEGIGLKTGLETEWGLGCGFHLYGSVGGSLLYGHLNDKSDNVLHPVPLITAPTVHNVQKNRDCFCSGITDSALGLCWKHDFCDNVCSCFIQLGWEHHLFLYQNHFADATGRRLNPPGRGDLCLQGVVLTAKFQF